MTITTRLIAVFLGMIAMAWSGQAVAETPACFCQPKDTKVAISPALDCLKVSTAGPDVCYGRTINFTVTNACAESVTIEVKHPLGDDPREQVIEAGTDNNWVEQLNPIVPANQTQQRTIVRTVKQGQATHTLTAELTVQCQRSSSSSSSSCSWAWPRVSCDWWRSVLVFSCSYLWDSRALSSYPIFLFNSDISLSLC